ncbi:unnamed protein product [Rhizophagus irregularis]|nr:unnamed protein product [Rhizophagus irregularis]
MDEREVTPELSQISILDSHIGIRFWYIWMRENSGGQVSPIVFPFPFRPSLPFRSPLFLTPSSASFSWK